MSNDPPPLSPDEVQQLAAHEAQLEAERPWYRKLSDWSQQFAAGNPYLGWALLPLGVFLLLVAAVYALFGKDDKPRT